MPGDLNFRESPPASLAWFGGTIQMAVAVSEQLDFSLPEETTCPSVRTLFWTLSAALGWGVLQFWTVAFIAGTVGWTNLPYNTIEEVAIWLFLATNASAWVILSYALYRFKKPILWFWWAACATWWLTLFFPFRAAHADFRSKLATSQRAGEQLAGRVDAFRKQRGRLPGQLREVTLRDGIPIPMTSFDSNFEYRQQGLSRYELVIRAGDKAYCYTSRKPRAGFQLRYTPD